MIYTVRKGMRYRATISLGMFESLASNDRVAKKLTDAGFTEVNATGRGRRRTVTALWPHADVTSTVPQQVVSLKEDWDAKP